jgi:catechol 2,3-dioxygenase-like lactoylglutathione lyase family enzyme
MRNDRIVTLGTWDLARAGAFYDALLAEIDAQHVLDFEQTISWGVAPDKPTLAVTKPYYDKAATVGNGVMVALRMDSPEAGHRVHRKALDLGGQDEGPAGPRSGSYYFGYFRDLDGNKLALHCTRV